MGTAVTITTSVRIDAALVPIGATNGPIADDAYIEGTVALRVGDVEVMSEAQVDLVDQLWAYLVDGLEAVAADRPFAAYYPDMPVRLELTPGRDLVTIAVDVAGQRRQAAVARAHLLDVAVRAGREFFEWLAAIAPARRGACGRYLARLAVLTAGAG